MKKKGKVEGQVTYLFENKMPRIVDEDMPKHKPRCSPMPTPVENTDVYALKPTRVDELHSIIENDFADVWMKKTKTDQWGQYSFDLEEGEYSLVADFGRHGIGMMTYEVGEYADLVTIKDGETVRKDIKRHDVVY